MHYCTIIVKQFFATRNKTKFRSDKNSRSYEVSGRRGLEISMLADSIKRLERLARGHYRGAMRMGPAAAGPIVIRKKSSSRSVEKIRS